MADKYYGEYTQGLDDKYYELSEEYDYEQILDYIDTEIRTFPERLLAFYNKQTNQELSAAEAKEDLLKRAAKKGVYLNRNTVNDWFANDIHRMNDSTRKNLFKLAFVLDLEIDDVKELFNHVLLDRAFNLRRYDEFIYLFCLWNEKPYSTAETLISTAKAKLDACDQDNDETVPTFLIEDFIWGADEETLLKYIEEHKHNFSLSNVTGARLFQEKWAEITGTKEKKGLAQRESELEEHTDYENGKPVSSFKNLSKYSNDFALRIILGPNPVKQAGEQNIFKEQFRKEIANQFPDKQSIKKTDSSYILRKNLILAYFYWYWIKAKLERDSSVSFEGFSDELDGILSESGFSMLYPGNPYDALFIYSAYTYDAETGPMTVLNTFREIIDVEPDDSDW